MGSADTLDHAGFIVSASATDGHELWRVNLPLEDPTQFNPALGIYGFNQYVDTRARFTSDGSTAHIVTATATGDNNTSKSFVYSLNAALTPPTTKLRSTSITLSARMLKNSLVTITGVLTAKDQAGVAVSGATVNATWTLPNGATQNQTVSTDLTGKASLSIRSARGTYILTVNNLAKPGYTFDPANSVLSQSITVATSASTSISVQQ